MTWEVVIEAEAEREFAGAVDFYDGREPGLGQRFALEVLEAFREVARDPERFALVTRLTRRVKVLDWPYSIYYTLNPQARQVIITTLWHGARNPMELRRRLR